MGHARSQPRANGRRCGVIAAALRSADHGHSRAGRRIDRSGRPSPTAIDVAVTEVGQPVRPVAAILDRRAGRAIVVWSDGPQAALPLEASAFEPTSRLDRVTYLFDENLAHMVTTAGEHIVAELPTTADAAPRRGRPVIYLDQKDWSTLSQVRYDPARIGSAEEREAGEALLALSEAGRVIVPLSAGHMAETCRWTNDSRRYQLALTIAQSSRGWQLRDPLDVRRLELQAALVGHRDRRPQPPPQAVTLAPNACVGRARGLEAAQTAELPDRVELASRALTSVTTYFDVMLDDDAIETVAVPGWAARHQRFTDWLAGSGRHRSAKDASIDVFFLSDLGTELPLAAASAGITPEGLGSWVQTSADRDVAAMPCLGLFREALREKHLNSSTKWKAGDLADLMYLTCAAGYADHVVAERQMAGQLARAANRLGRHLSVHRNLSELLPRLDIQDDPSGGTDRPQEGT
jgi:hypothetical protein